MAHLNLEEFEDCITVLVDGGAPEKLRDRLCQLNAFHSRRGLSTAKAISARLYQLSSGLRREVPSTQAFQALWADFIGTRLTEAAGEKLDELADKINENLKCISELRLKHNFRFVLHFVVQRDNYHEMEDIILLGKKYNAYRVWLNRITDWQTYDNFAQRDVVASAHPDHDSFQKAFAKIKTDDHFVGYPTLG